jgi:hypothetical protein
MRWSLDEKKSSCEASQKAHADKRKKHAGRKIQMPAISTAADGSAYPER